MNDILSDQSEKDDDNNDNSKTDCVEMRISVKKAPDYHLMEDK